MCMLLPRLGWVSPKEKGLECSLPVTRGPFEGLHRNPGKDSDLEGYVSVMPPCQSVA